MRHDLRGPLTVIMGRAELLQAEVHGPLNEGQRGCLDAIMRSTVRLASELDALGDAIDEALG